jgi:cell wall assembly regulator SMI1
MASKIRGLWDAIEAQLTQHAPSVLTTLNPAASDSQIEDLASALGRPLPDDLVESLRNHNGQTDTTRLKLLTRCGLILSSARMLEVWQMITEIDEDLKKTTPNRSGSESWNRHYLPLTDFEGDSLCINLGPRKYGEILWFVHDNGIEHDVFPSYSDWLEDVADVFLTKRFTIEERRINFWPGITRK